MKTKKGEIAGVSVVSPSPLVVNVKHTDGSCDQSNIRQLSAGYTRPALDAIIREARRQIGGEVE